MLVAAHAKQKGRQFKLYILQQEHNREKKPRIVTLDQIPKLELSHLLLLNHGIIWVEGDLWISNFLLKVTSVSQLDHIAQGFVHLSFQYLQGQKSHSLSVPCSLSLLVCKGFFLYIQPEFPVLLM